MTETGDNSLHSLTKFAKMRIYKYILIVYNIASMVRVSEATNKNLPSSGMSKMSRVTLRPITTARILVLMKCCISECTTQ